MNPFGWRGKTGADEDLERFIESIRDDREKRVLYLNVLRALIHLMKGFVVETRDLNAERFKKALDRLAERFTSDEQAKPLGRFFEGHKDVIIDFIGRQHHYLAEREQELRDIIDLLGRAMAAIDSDNQSYHKNIYAQSEKIERLTDLEDIKKIKTSLRQEVTRIQEIIADKQDRDGDRMQRLKSQIDSLNLELARARNESITDALTGTFNRKAFDAHLLQLVEANTVRPKPFALLLIDIDSFKQINDTHGHPVGDRVLASVVEKCRQAIRESDFLGRYGGDEFAVILPGASLRHAAKRGRSLCKAIAAAQYTLSEAPGAEKIVLTVSIGIAVPRPGDTVATVIDRADKALYAAKDGGKNRVAVESEAAA